MAKFGVNVVVLVNNMLLVFFYFFSKNLSKKISCTAYTMKKIFGRSFQLKRKILQGKFFYPPPRISNGPPLSMANTIMAPVKIDKTPTCTRLKTNRIQFE